jgi:hypothetical protein
MLQPNKLECFTLKTCVVYTNVLRSLGARLWGAYPQILPLAENDCHGLTYSQDSMANF